MKYLYRCLALTLAALAAGLADAAQAPQLCRLRPVPAMNTVVQAVVVGADAAVCNQIVAERQRLIQAHITQQAAMYGQAHAVQQVASAQATTTTTMTAGSVQVAQQQAAGSLECTNGACTINNVGANGQAGAQASAQASAYAQAIAQANAQANAQAAASAAGRPDKNGDDSDSDSDDEGKHGRGRDKERGKGRGDRKGSKERGKGRGDRKGSKERGGGRGGKSSRSGSKSGGKDC